MLLYPASSRLHQGVKEPVDGGRGSGIGARGQKIGGVQVVAVDDTGVYSVEGLYPTVGL